MFSTPSPIISETSDELPDELPVQIPTEPSDPYQPLSDPFQRKSRTLFQSKLIYYFNGPVFLYPNSKILSNYLADSPLIMKSSAENSHAPKELKSLPTPDLQNLLSDEPSNSEIVPQESVNKSASSTDSSRLPARKPIQPSAQRIELPNSDVPDAELPDDRKTDDPKLLEAKRSDATLAASFSK